MGILRTFFHDGVTQRYPSYQYADTSVTQRHLIYTFPKGRSSHGFIHRLGQGPPRQALFAHVGPPINMT